MAIFVDPSELGAFETGPYHCLLLSSKDSRPLGRPLAADPLRESVVRRAVEVLTPPPISASRGWSAVARLRSRIRIQVRHSGEMSRTVFGALRQCVMRGCAFHRARQPHGPVPPPPMAGPCPPRIRHSPLRLSHHRTLAPSPALNLFPVSLTMLLRSYICRRTQGEVFRFPSSNRVQMSNHPDPELTFRPDSRCWPGWRPAGMSTALSLDLRVRVLAAVAGGLSHRAAGERFGVSAASVSRWRTREREQGDARPKALGGDRKSHRIGRSQGHDPCCTRPRPRPDDRGDASGARRGGPRFRLRYAPPLLSAPQDHA